MNHLAHEIFKGDIFGQELTGDSTSIDYHNTIGDRIDVKNIMVNEDR
jgi:hypothetical protein